MYAADQINATAVQIGIDPAYVLTPDDRMTIAGLMIAAYDASQNALSVIEQQKQSGDLNGIMVAQQGLDTSQAAWEQKISPVSSST